MNASIQASTKKSGKTYLYIVISYKDPETQKRKTKWISTNLEERGNKRKAEKLIPEILEKYKYLENPLPELDTDNIDPDILLADYVELWLSKKKREVERSTYEGYVLRAKHVTSYFRKKQIRIIDLTSKNVDSFITYECNYGKINQKTKKRGPLSVRSVRSIKGILLAAMNQAMIDGLVKHNPVIPVKVAGKKDSDYRKNECFLVADEAKDLLLFLAKEYPRLFPIAYMCIYYGLRRSEILGLKWSAIDFDKKIICIQHTVVRVTTIQEKDSTKTKSSNRKLELLESIIPCLEKVRQEQEYNERYFKNSYIDNEDYIFTWEDGRKYDPDYISKLFKKATAQYGRPDITLHKLRHSCASILFDLGWEPKKVQYWLGHATWDTTMNIYTHYKKERLTQQNTGLDEALDLRDVVF